MLPAWVLVLSVAAAPAHSVSTTKRSCEQTQYGQCFKIRGRYATYVENDLLWIVGTRHMLIATDDKLDQMLEDASWEEHVVFGDFVVCPTSPYIKGEMQSACIQSYKNIKLARRK